MLNSRHLSLRSKQMLIIMLTSAVALLLACAAFVAFDVYRFRRQMVASVSSLAEVVGNNTTAALDFDDPASAVQTLQALRGQPGIVMAHVHTLDGRQFASYVREGAEPAPRIPLSLMARHEFTARHLHLFRPIVQAGEVVGTIELVATLDELNERLWRYAGIAGLVLFTSLLAAFGLSSRLQRFISDPILELAQVARSVALEKNYAVRATKQSNDELGQLVDGFNAMLAQIQERDANLERRVEERTDELAKSQGLYHSLVEQLPTGVYRKDAEGRYVFANSWFLRLKRRWADQVIGKMPHELYQPAQCAPGTAPPEDWEARLALQGEADHVMIINTGRSIATEEKHPAAGGKSRYLQVLKTPVFAAGGKIIGSQGILFDISERKEAEAALAALHSELLDKSRQAGMAEVATNVLHNVGNVLNSVNISTDLIVERVKKSRASGLGRVVTLLEEHASDLGEFMTHDNRGKHVPAHLAQLSAHLLADQADIISELHSLRRNVEHIKEIVAMQQNYATVGGVKEMVNVITLVEDSLRMNEGSLTRHRVEVLREYENVPLMNVEKHKILQIMVNLLRNAKYACEESGHVDHRLTVRLTYGEARVRISVGDNGVGIPPENLTRIFSYGFTTRKTGHGFGLHSGALAAKEMGGSLTAHSDGPGLGSTFTLELPCPPPENTNE